MRSLTADGFGPKSRHDWVPDPEGRKHPDGMPVMVESNADSWNSNLYYERCREDWENTANAALARAGSAERIDRRSLLERGLARMPEPALRLAHHLKELRGVMKERFGQFQMARHYRAVEARAQGVFRIADTPAMLAAWAERANPPDRHAASGAADRGAPAGTPRWAENPARKVERFIAWFERQRARLAPAAPEHGRCADALAKERGNPRSPPTQSMER
jgi:hypothetical protein